MAALTPPQTVYGPPATAEERQLVQSYLASNNPQLQQQAMALMQKVVDRMRSPIEYRIHYECSTGQTVYIPAVPGYGPIQIAQPPPEWRRPDTCPPVNEP